MAEAGINSLALYDKLQRAVLRRTRLRGAVREVKRARRRTLEALGSDRYSHPALDDLDRKLAAYLPRQGGVFVEAGAFDGYWQSNTYWFERFRGWSGVLVEPIPQLAAEARRERPRAQVFEFALVAPDFPEKTVRMRFGGTMSILLADSGEMEDALAHADRGAAIAEARAYDLDVPTSTLSAVLDQAGVEQIDLLSLDVEGHEEEALKGLDFDRHAPEYILIEILFEQTGKAPVYELLEPRYEFVEQLSVRDHLFRLR
jgi:FkbM family methyltransferase